mgnify:CR=1 FL=1
MRILVADDDPDLCMLVRLFLTKNGGHDVATVPDGEKAIAHLRTEDVDLVLLDWNMPKVDGVGVAKAVRGELDRPDLPLLMVTAVPEHAEAMAAGVDHVLMKPFTSASLVEAVEHTAALVAERVGS